ncbi:MAG: glycosyltransferase [Muribaculaceae bacterium]|nr:glycosyltransferase [Muribaculaceae bacterium]
MRVSVVTVVKNRAEALAATFASVMEQTHGDVEFVVVDGASTDGTVAWLEAHARLSGGRLRWISEPDSGIYNAMNKGLAMATGQAVGFLGAGDTFFDSRSLRVIAETLEEADVDAVYGDLVFVRESNPGRVCRSWRGSQFVPGIFRRGWQPAHPTFFVRRECFEQHGGFDEALEISADFDIMYRMLEKCRISNRYIPRTLVRMLAGGTSNASLRNIFVAHRNIRRSFCKYGDTAPLLYSVRRLLPKVLNTIESRFS